MEIEKKFLIDKLPFDMSKYRKLDIMQAYVSLSPVIRIRRILEENIDTYILTIKGSASNSVRTANVSEEFELYMSKDEFSSLFDKIDENSTPIEKTRYLIPLDNGLTAEVDQYYGNLKGLYTVEVEFESVEQANVFIPPFWFGLDVSGNKHYSNSSLSVNGLIPNNF